jgi:membrane fusion protein, multidrug efflux system
MFEDKVLERDNFALEQTEGFHSVPGSLRETTPQHSPAAWQPPSPAEQDEEEPRAPGKQRGNGLLRRRPVLSAIGAMLLAAALGSGYAYLDYTKHFQSTDDAFIAARQTALAPKVSGYLTTVPVTDNEHVATGDVIARIDDRDYRIALAQAEAQVAAAQASIDNIDAQLQVQQAQISANEAQVDQAQAALVFAQQQAQRYQHLAQTGFGTVQNDQQWNSQQHQQEAALRSAQATLKLSQRQIEALKAQRNSALANLAQAQAQRDQAKLNLPTRR